MFTKPIIILGAPRSGTTILTRCLAMHPDLWHLPGESHSILEGPFHPALIGYRSNKVGSEMVDKLLIPQLQHQGIQFHQVNFQYPNSQRKGLEDINLSIAKIIESSGTQLVVPTRTTYFEGATVPAGG